MKMKTNERNENENQKWSHRYNINRPTITFIIFWDFLMFYQIITGAIITYKHGICELRAKLPNNWRLKTGKCLNLTEW